MNVRLVIFAACGLLTIAAPAVAAPVITFTPMSYTLPANTSAVVFRDFESSPDGGSQYVPAANELKTGDVRVYSSAVPGLAAETDSENGNHFLSIVNGSYSVSFATPVQFFSFVIGSVDSYNNLVLSYADGSFQSLTGRQIIGDSVVGPYNSGTWGRVNYDLGGQAGIVTATFSSAQASLEIDDLASAVPEPGSWSMMILGIGMIGLFTRRRRASALRVA
jgi:hypothetical protein